jgi:hypothetical protein
MMVSDIVWAVCLSVWGLEITIGVTILTATPSHPKGARILFWLSPLGPILANFVWILTTAPSVVQCGVASALIGATVTIALAESLRWLETREQKYEQRSS